jgi:hypothetical protein
MTPAFGENLVAEYRENAQAHLYVAIYSEPFVHAILKGGHMMVDGLCSALQVKIEAGCFEPLMAKLANSVVSDATAMLEVMSKAFAELFETNKTMEVCARTCTANPTGPILMRTDGLSTLYLLIVELARLLPTLPVKDGANFACSWRLMAAHVPTSEALKLTGDRILFQVASIARRIVECSQAADAEKPALMAAILGFILHEAIKRVPVSFTEHGRYSALIYLYLGCVQAAVHRGETVG